MVGVFFTTDRNLVFRFTSEGYWIVKDNAYYFAHIYSECLQVVSDILRTFVSERLQMTNVSWRSRSNRAVGPENWTT